MARSKLCTLTDATNRRPLSARGNSGRDGYCLSSSENSIIIVL
jgi:hypothetical protein